VPPLNTKLNQAIISKFKNITKCPVIVNTSFNIRGEPIVCSPKDAFKCFMGTELDYLIIGNCVLSKEKQDKLLKLNYNDMYELD
jgi:carbamoyltransferase